MTRIALLITMVFAFTSVFAQTARLQVIHNSSDPAAARVDVYLNGDLLLDNFKFRTATPFIDAPAETEITVSIAPNTSTSVEDAIANFTYTLMDGETYVIVANGVLDPDAFGTNPDGTSTAFNLFVYAGARESALSSDNVDFIFFHGATDAPTVDALARNVATVVDNASYTDFTGYVSVPADKYLLDVTPGDDNSIIVATARAFLPNAGGAAAVVFASGFLSTDDEPAGAKSFGLYYALPDGTVKQFPFISTSKVQIIHNAADPAAAEVDIYLNGDLAIDNFAFRTATPYLDLPGNVELSIAVAPSTSESVDDAIATFNATFKAGAGYTALANGVLNPDAFTANPDGAEIGFNLWIREGAKPFVEFGNGVEFIGVHGSTDAPTVDIIARDVATLLDNVSYGAVSDYILVPAASYILDVALGDAPETVVVSYSADLSSLGGNTAVVFASGFLDPTAGPDGSEGFGLWYAFADGTTGAFPVYTFTTPEVSRVAGVEANVFPNPANDLLNITFDQAFNGTLNLVSVDGRIVMSENYFSENAGSISFDVKGLSSGIYYLNMINDNAASTLPIMIK